MISKRDASSPLQPLQQSTDQTVQSPLAPDDLNGAVPLIPGDAHAFTPLLPADGADSPFGPAPAPDMPFGPVADVDAVLKPLIERSYVPTGERPSLKRAVLGDDTLDPEPYIQAQGRSTPTNRHQNGTSDAEAVASRPAQQHSGPPAILPGTGPLPELVLPPLPDRVALPDPAHAPARAHAVAEPPTPAAPAEPHPEPAQAAATAPEAQPGGTAAPARPVPMPAPPLLVYALVQRIMSSFPQGVVLDKTPEIEQMLAGRFIAALSQVPGPIPPGGQEALFAAAIDEILGLGPLEALVNDDSITEIMVNGPSYVSIERNGHTTDSGVTFQSEEHLNRIAQRIVKPLGRALNRHHPIADARLADGSRVSIIVPPCAVHGTTIAIRKVPRRLLSLDDLVAAGTLTTNVAGFLWACVAARINIFVTGPASSGKTTFLNALASFVPAGERIVTIEESAQLHFDRPNVVSLEAQPPSLDDAPGVSLDRLLATALRMRPRRLVVGDLHGPETATLLHAINTGFDGSLASLYATSPADALARLEAMAAPANPGLPLRSLREQIASAADILVHLTRLPDGSRRLVAISEVQGMQGDTVVLTDIFRSTHPGPAPAALVPTGHLPTLLQRLALFGHPIDPAIFSA